MWVRFDGTQGEEYLKELCGPEENGTLKMDFLGSTRLLVFCLSLLKLRITPMLGFVVVL